jgi:tetratricopeptide (TPR) repeat protein
LGDFACWLGAGTSIALGLLLFLAGYRNQLVDRLETTAALRPEIEDRINCLRQAVRFAPDNAELHASLGRARLELFCWQQMDSQLLAALRDYRRARNCCPLLSEPHQVLATYADWLEKADPWDAYLERVKLLAGSDAALWYQCGVQELEANKPDRTWASWRRSLELSDRYLAPILESSARLLPPAKMVDFVLPDRPVLLVAAAARFSQEPDKRPFFEKALRILDGRAETTVEELEVKATAQKALGRRDEALRTYRCLLARQPGQADWRCELAQLLRDRGQREEARHELVVALAQHPNHARARELLALVTRELARQR